MPLAAAAGLSGSCLAGTKGGPYAGARASSAPASTPEKVLLVDDSDPTVGSEASGRPERRARATLNAAALGDGKDGMERASAASVADRSVPRGERRKERNVEAGVESTLWDALGLAAIDRPGPSRLEGVRSERSVSDGPQVEWSELAASWSVRARSATEWRRLIASSSMLGMVSGAAVASTVCVCTLGLAAALAASRALRRRLRQRRSVRAMHTSAPTGPASSTRRGVADDRFAADASGTTAGGDSISSTWMAMVEVLRKALAALVLPRLVARAEAPSSAVAVEG